MASRDRLAARSGGEFGADLMFPELIAALLEELPHGHSVLEVGAANGIVTRDLVPYAGMVTALEISEGMLKLLLSNVGDAENLRVMQGVVEDLPRELAFDDAVVTFTFRRGHALAMLMAELAMRVAERIVVVFPDDRTMDWAYLARTCSAQGFDVRLRMVRGQANHRGVLMVADVEDWMPIPEEDDWAVDSREIDVPYPPPRGTASRLVRYFLTVGDRAMLVSTDERGIERLYGNLRTAAHRLGHGAITVRMQDEGIQVMRLPRAPEGPE